MPVIAAIMPLPANANAPVTSKIGAGLELVDNVAAALATKRQGPVLVLVERAGPAVAGALSMGVAPRAALRHWVNAATSLLRLINKSPGDIILITREAAEGDSIRLANALAGPLGGEIAAAELANAATAGRHGEPDAVLEVIAEVIVSTDVAALLADSELETLILSLDPRDVRDPGRARLAMATEALRQRALQARAHERLKAGHDALVEVIRLAKERSDLLDHSRTELIAEIGRGASRPS